MFFLSLGLLSVKHPATLASATWKPLSHPNRPFPTNPNRPFPTHQNRLFSTHPNRLFPTHQNMPFPTQPNRPFPTHPNMPFPTHPNMPFPTHPNMRAKGLAMGWFLQGLKQWPLVCFLLDRVPGRRQLLNAENHLLDNAHPTAVVFTSPSTVLVVNFYGFFFPKRRVL